MTRRTPALENVTVRVKDRNGNTKASFSSVEKFINFVTGTNEKGWYNKNNVAPKVPRPWYLRWIP
jgi:hypothetical protein